MNPRIRLRKSLGACGRLAVLVAMLVMAGLLTANARVNPRGIAAQRVEILDEARRDRAQAPERLRIEILETQEGTEDRVEIRARVLAVARSASGLVPGDRIRIDASLRRIGGVGIEKWVIAEMPAPAQGDEREAFLTVGPAGEGEGPPIYQPAASVWSLQDDEDFERECDAARQELESREKKERAPETDPAPPPEDAAAEPDAEWLAVVRDNVAVTDVTVRARLVSTRELSRDQLYVSYEQRYARVEAIKGDPEAEFSVFHHAELGFEPPEPGGVRLLSLCRSGEASYYEPDNAFSFPDHPALAASARSAPKLLPAVTGGYCE